MTRIVYNNVSGCFLVCITPNKHHDSSLQYDHDENTMH